MIGCWRRGTGIFKSYVKNSNTPNRWPGRPQMQSSPLQRALGRAARRAFLWPEEAEEIHARGESLTVLSGIGPYLNKQIIGWLRHPPELEGAIPEIRRNFLTFAEARKLRSKHPERFTEIRGDLILIQSDPQLHVGGSTTEMVSKCS